MDWESSTSLSSQVFGNTSTPPNSCPSILYRDRLNVVLFGEVGVGKSSIVNLIARKYIAKVSLDISGCTTQYQCYPISFDNMDFAIYDTIGIKDRRMEVNGYLKAIENAYELINKLSAVGGIHLFLFCMRGGRITEDMQSNYRLLCECLCDLRVPIALVVTGLEEEDRMESWWDRNGTLVDHYGIQSQGHACITTVRDTPEEEYKYEKSQETIRELLKSCARKGDLYSPESQRWFARLGIQLKSFLPEKSPKRKNIVKMLMYYCKLDADTAKRIAQMMEKRDTENENEGTTPQPEEGVTPHQEGVTSQPKQGMAQQQNKDAAPQLKQAMAPQGATPQQKQGTKPQPGEEEGGEGGSVYEVPDEGSSEQDNQTRDATPEKKYASTTGVRQSSFHEKTPKKSMDKGGMEDKDAQLDIAEVTPVSSDAGKRNDGLAKQAKGGQHNAKDTNAKAMPHFVPNRGRDGSKKSVTPGGVALSLSSNTKVVAIIGKEGSNAGNSREMSDDEPLVVTLANFEQRKLGLPSLVISFGP